MSKLEDSINIFKALSDSGRLRVMLALYAFDELCVCQIVEMLNLATATVSRHMLVLQQAQLVQSRKDGRWVYYSRTPHIPQNMEHWIKEDLLSISAIKEDRKKLKKILCCDPNELCKQQKSRKV